MPADIPLHPAAPRIGIIGGGIIGRACGRELLRAGFRVRIYDDPALLPGGSVSAAGLLGPISEFLAGEVSDPLFAAGYESLGLWAEWAHALGDIGFRRAGCLHLGSDGARFAQIAARAAALGLNAMLLDAEAVRNIDRRLQATAGQTGLFLPDEAEIHARATLSALRVDFLANGGEWVEARAPRLAEAGGTIRGILDPIGELWTADAVLIAAGAASRDFAEWAPELAAIHPVKGQLGVLDALSPPLPTVLRFRGGYLAPKTDGTMLLGASMEPDRSDAGTDPAVLAQLHANLVAVAPLLAQRKPLQGRAGVRAGARAGIPLIGRLSDSGQTAVGRLWAAAGHGRNGLLLAPHTARQIAAAMAREFGLTPPA